MRNGHPTRRRDSATLQACEAIIKLNTVTPYETFRKMLEALELRSGNVNIAQLMQDFKATHPDLIVRNVRKQGYYVERAR